MAKINRNRTVEINEMGTFLRVEVVEVGDTLVFGWPVKEQISRCDAFKWYKHNRQYIESVIKKKALCKK